MYHVAMPTTHPQSRSDTRRGRVLVECLVSLVLVSGASSLVLLLASTTAHVVDDARQRDLVLRESARLRAPVLRAPCLAVAGTEQRSVGPRTTLEANASNAGGLHSIVVSANWRSSGFRGASTHTYRTSVSGWCE